MAQGNHLSDEDLVLVLRSPDYESGVCRHAADRIEDLGRKLVLAEAKPCVEHCQEERAAGNGGCGACALCCKEQKDHADLVEAKLKAIWTMVAAAQKTGLSLDGPRALEALAEYSTL